MNEAGNNLFMMIALLAVYLLFILKNNLQELSLKPLETQNVFRDYLQNSLRICKGQKSDHPLS